MKTVNKRKKKVAPELKMWSEVCEVTGRTIARWYDRNGHSKQALIKNNCI